jgi:hypothetical protein
MKKHIHDEKREKHPSEKYMFTINSPPKRNYSSSKGERAKYTTFYHLLDIPTFWYIVAIYILDLLTRFSG